MRNTLINQKIDCLMFVCGCLMAVLPAVGATVSIDAPAGQTVVSEKITGNTTVIVNANGSGTVVLNGASDYTGDTTLVNGTLKVAEGAITTSGNVYIGDANTASADPLRFEMTGGSIWLKPADHTLYVANGAHESVAQIDISGGKLVSGKNIAIAYQGGNCKKTVDIMIRNNANVEIPNTSGRRFYFDSTHASSAFSLTIRDGGSLTTPLLCRASASVQPVAVLLDGANVNWQGNSPENPFQGSYAAITDQIKVGAQGVVFTGSASSKVLTYTIPLVAGAGVDGDENQGVTFKTASYTLSAANSYLGPTIVAKDAKLFVASGGSLPSTTVLKLDGELDVVAGSPLSVGSVAGAGRISVYADTGRTQLVTANGTYPVLTVPLSEKEALLAFATTLKSGNDGVFLVSEDGDTLTLNLVIGASADQPDCTALGAGGGATVRWACVAETELVEGVRRIVPNTYAVLAASASTGRVVAYWRDDATGEILQGEHVSLFVTNSTTYTAVFGNPWVWDASAKTVSNGDWTFAATASGTELTLGTPTAAAADGVLNLATPVRDSSGAEYQIVQLGKSDKGSFFYDAGSDIKEALTAVCLPFGLRVIGQSAFRGCANLEFVEPFLPDSVTVLAGLAFYGANKLTGSLRANGLTRICYMTFFKAYKLSGDVHLPNVVSVGSGAFCWTSVSNYYFGTNQVDFIDERNGDPGDRTFYRDAGAKTVRRFVFPGRAPLLHESSPGSHAAGRLLFGADNGYDCLCGSWRLDKEGWTTLRGTVGAASSSGKSPVPDLLPGERRFRGTFQCVGEQEGSYFWGWLIDMEVPGEPQAPGLILLLR